MQKAIRSTALSSVRKNILRISALVLCLVCVAFTLPTAGEPVSAAVSDAKSRELEDKIKALNQQMASLQSQITDAKDDISKAIAEKQRLDSEMNILIQKVELTTELIAELNANIEQKNGEISEREDAYAKKYELFKQRLRVTHEDGQISYIQMLFGATSLADFLSRVDRIGAMLDYDTTVMDQLKAEKHELEGARTDYQTKKAAQEEYLASLKADEAALEKKKTEAASYLNKLQSNQALYKAMLEKIDEEEQKLQATLQAYLKELQERENSKYVGGTFLWPLPTSYTRISSVYGGRTSPITGRWEFHNGIDLPAAYGTSIYAANSGKVTIATSHWSYGNYIMIDHGGGYATLYAHCSKLLVSVGDKVTRGQVIAQVGSTGSSTGNHLHFSLYENSAHTDPMKFYK